MDKIFIEKTTNNWVELELKQGDQLVLNFVRADVDDLQNRNSNFSQNIELPGTQRNRKGFDQVYNIDKYSTNLNSIFMNKIFNCEYILDGITFNGVLELNTVDVLNETGEVTFNCSIRSNSILIKERIGDRFLKGNVLKSDDLDFSAYRHTFNMTNIRNSWLTGIGSGYYYPLINYNNYGKTNLIKAETQRPALYAKEIIDKIFQKTGLTYQSNFMNTDEFKSIIHPWVGRPKNDEEELDTRKFRVGFVAATYEPLARGWNNPGFNIINIPLDNRSAPDPLLFFDNDNNFFVSNSSFFVKKPGMYRFNLAAAIKPVILFFQRPGFHLVKGGSYSDVKVSVILTRGGSETVLGSTSIKYEPTTGRVINVLNMGLDRFTDDRITVVVRTAETQLYINDRIYTRIEFNNNINFRDIQGRDINSPSITYQFQRSNDDGTAATVFSNEALQSNDLFLGEEVNACDGLPDRVKQYDYFKSILNMFNMVISENPTNPTNFRIEPRTDIIGTGNTYNWDHKVNNNEIIEIKRVPLLVDKNVHFKYQDDKDNYNTDYSTTFEETYGNYRKLNRQVTENDYDISVLFSQTPHNLHNNSNVILPQLFTLNTSGVNIFNTQYKMRVLYRTDINTVDSPQNIRFNQYTGGRIFNIYLIGDQFGVNNQRIRITNDTWYNLARDPFFFFKTSIIPTANHFQNPYDPFTNDLNFGYQKTYYAKLPNLYPTVKNLYNRFWSELIEDLIDINSKLITIEVKLTSQEIYDLSFDDIIIYSGQQWIINKIENWSSGKMASVELLKINVK